MTATCGHLDPIADVCYPDDLMFELEGAPPAPLHW